MIDNDVQRDDKMLSTLKTTPDFLGVALVTGTFAEANVGLGLQGDTVSVKQGSLGAAVMVLLASGEDDDDDEGERLTRVWEL